MRQRVCLLVTQGGWGGAQRYVFDLAMGLRDRFDVVVAAGEMSGGDELIRRLDAAGVKTVRVRHLRRAIRPLDDVSAIFEIAGFLRAGRFDIVHTNSSKADVLGAIAARLASPRPRTISTVHGWVFLEPMGRLRRLLYVAVERLAGRLRDATIVLSKRERDAAVAYKICRPERLTVIPLGIAPVTPMAGREPRAEIIVGTIANLYPTKGLDVLAQAALNVKRRFPATRFVVIGEGPERLALEKYGSLELRGAIPDASRFLSDFDIFVLPSRKEGLPYALLEAMSAGLPVIATAVGGIPEVIEQEKNGLLVPAGDVAALADAIARLANDESLRQRLSAAARDSSRAFSLDLEINATLACYQRLK